MLGKDQAGDCLPGAIEEAELSGDAAGNISRGLCSTLGSAIRTLEGSEARGQMFMITSECDGISRVCIVFGTVMSIAQPMGEVLHARAEFLTTCK